MRPALINLTKKIELTSKTTNPALAELYLSLKTFLLRVFDSNNTDNFETIKKNEEWSQRIRQLINRDNRYLEMLATDYPTLTLGTPSGKIKVKSALVEVVSGKKGDENSYQFDLHILTDTVTVIDNIGNSLLISIGNKSKEYNEGKEIETILLPICDEYNIKHYQKI
jgi:hypothetical protein